MCSGFALMTRSAGKRQPAVAMHVPSNGYTAEAMEANHIDSVAVPFSELGHVCTDVMLKDELETIRKGAAKALLAIARGVKAQQQNHGPKLPEHADVCKAVEESNESVA